MAAPARRAARPDAVVVAAVVLGALLRLAWAVWATRTPVQLGSDRAQYLYWAEQMADLRSPGLPGSPPSAVYAPGWPIALVPVVWLSRVTGWFSPVFGASLANVALSAATVAGTAGIARRWWDLRVARAAAVLAALCPLHVFYVATGYSETLFTALTVGVVWWCGRRVAPGGEDGWRPDPWALAVAGAGIGAAALTRGVGAWLLVVPAAALLLGTRRPGVVLRGLAWAVLGAAVVMAPWIVRNQVQLGSPYVSASNYSGAVCVGHFDGADGTAMAEDPVALDHCWSDSPWVDPEGEAEWSRSSITEAAGWAVLHPGEEVRLTGQKTWETLGRPDFAVGEILVDHPDGLMSVRVRSALDAAASAWYFGAAALALLALWARPSARAATVVWSAPVALLLSTYVGHGLPRYQHPLLPFVAVFAAVTLGGGPEPRARTSPRRRALLGTAAVGLAPVVVASVIWGTGPGLLLALLAGALGVQALLLAPSGPGRVLRGHDPVVPDDPVAPDDPGPTGEGEAQASAASSSA